MSDYFGAAKDLIGGVFSGIGALDSAGGYKAAAATYAHAAAISQIQTRLKETALNRQIFQTIGGARADVGASGLEEGGSAADVIRASAQQGEISKSITALQGEIDYSSYMAQSKSAEAQAAASTSGGIGDFLGGALSVGALFFSDDDLKTDVKFMRRREDGIGIYSFSYVGNKKLFEGVLASEVEKIYPKAIWYNELGFRMIDYDMIRVPFRELQRA